MKNANDVLQILEQKLKEVNERIRAYQTQVLAIKSDIEKFQSAKEQMEDALKALDGARQAYELAISETKDLSAKAENTEAEKTTEVKKA